MRRLIAASSLVALAACGAGTTAIRTDTVRTTDRPPLGSGVPGSSLDGMGPPIQARVDLLADTHLVLTLIAQHHLEVVLAAQRAADASRRASSSSTRSTSPTRSTRAAPVVTGSCAAMKPAGFPDWIIQRESRGIPTARSSSGAYGCAQLMPGHLTGNYAADWARLWNNGAGACNWDPPNYCAG